MMTEQEYQALASRIVALLKSTSKTIAELPREGSPGRDDLVELSEGRSATLGSISDAMLKIGSDDRFLSALSDDRAEGLITFVRGLVSESLAKFKGGAEFGDFLDSMLLGKGGAVDSQGNAQFQSVTVRGYMLVAELIINRLSAVESDFVFNESGTVEKAEPLQDGTWLLTLRKRWAYDFTAFKENDVLYGSVNTLLSDGSSYTAWMRVNSVNLSANQICVAIYPDAEVPAGKNYPPCEGMSLLHRGNAIDEDRQSAWYISSREGCIVYLEGVTKPILDQTNYYLIIGKLKRLDIFTNYPINYAHPYIYCKGILAQNFWGIDWQGNPAYEIVDVGLWDSAAQYIRGYDSASGKYVQHQAWHNSCCWRCAVPAATVGLPPRWNSTEWVCIANGNFTLEIASSNGRFFRPNQEYTTLSFILRHGDEDVTVDAWQVEWTRESGNAAEDLLWNTAHASSSMTLDISPADMPTDWLTRKKVAFRCTVTVKDGEDGAQSVSEEFTVNT